MASCTCALVYVDRCQRQRRPISVLVASNCWAKVAFFHPWLQGNRPSNGISITLQMIGPDDPRCKLRERRGNPFCTVHPSWKQWQLTNATLFCFLSDQHIIVPTQSVGIRMARLSKHDSCRTHSGAVMKGTGRPLDLATHASSRIWKLSGRTGFFYHGRSPRCLSAGI